MKSECGFKNPCSEYDSDGNLESQGISCLYPGAAVLWQHVKAKYAPDCNGEQSCPIWRSMLAQERQADTLEKIWSK